MLPPLWTRVEDNHSKMLLLQVFLRLSQHCGNRPLSINVDDLEGSFHLIASALELSFPAPVKRAFVYPSSGLDVDQQAFLASGGVLIDREHFQVYGLWLVTLLITAPIKVLITFLTKSHDPPSTFLNRIYKGFRV